MLTQQERQIRLQNEYHAMCAFPFNRYFQWKLSSGCTPSSATQYIVTYTFPTYIEGMQDSYDIQERTTVRIHITDGFPDSPPIVDVIDGKTPFVPNFYINGRLCPGSLWKTDGWIYDYVIKIGKLINFDPSVTNIESPACRNAIPLWNKNIHRFPINRISFPKPNGY